MRRRGCPSLRESRSEVGAGEGSRPDSSPNFSRRPGAQGAGRSPGVGSWNSGSRASAGRAGSLRPRSLAEGRWISDTEGPALPPNNCNGRTPGSRARAPAAPAHAARSPQTCARGPRARFPLTGRWRLDRPRGWSARRGRRAVLKLWAGTARPPSSLAVVRRLLPTFPSFPDPASRGVMSGARRAEWEGPREAGGVHRRERPEPGGPPPAQPASTRPTSG